MTPGIKKYRLSNLEVAQILEDFLEGKGSRWTWDDFTLGMSFEDENLEEIRIQCAALSQEFPSDSPNEYCNEQGRTLIRDYVKQLKALK
jgi:hypothetical protein